MDTCDVGDCDKQFIKNKVQTRRKAGETKQNPKINIYLCELCKKVTKIADYCVDCRRRYDRKHKEKLRPVSRVLKTIPTAHSFK